MTAARQFRLTVSGFPTVYAIAASHARARSITASAFAEAGFGSFGDGLRHIRSTRLDYGPPRPLASPRRGPEGMCRTLSVMDRCH